MATADDPHYFDFDLDRGIREQVVERLEGSPILPLTKSIGPKESGIYALYLNGNLVYVGKVSKGTTKSKRTLRARLNEHIKKISGRQNITLEEMQVRYLTFSSEWWVFAAEFALIVHYKPEWNYSGFGSKAEGVGRPGTDRVSNWNARYPVRLLSQPNEFQATLPLVFDQAQRLSLDNQLIERAALNVKARASRPRDFSQGGTRKNKRTLPVSLGPSSFATLAIPADDPKAMTLPRMVGCLPLI